VSARPDPDSFLAGGSGTVGGPRRRAVGRGRDIALDVAQAVAGTARALDRLAGQTRPLSVLVTGCYVPGPDSRLPAAIRELRSAGHDVTFAFGSTGAAPTLRSRTRRSPLA